MNYTMKKGIILITLSLLWLGAEAQNMPKLRRIEGQGNDGLVLDLVQGMHDSILNSPNHKYAHPVYEFNKGPVKIDVFNPALTPGGNYCIYFSDVNPSVAKWTLVHYGNPNDTIYGDSTVSAAYTQIIPQWGMSVFAGPVNQPGNSTANNNGFLEATMTFSNSNHWLTGITDVNNNSSLDWIKAGIGIDSAGYYETILNGTWAPYRLVAAYYLGDTIYTGPTPGWNQFQSLALMSRLSGVDVIITSNQSKWTRCPVIEAGWGDTIQYVRQLDLRADASVDKNGQPGDGIVTNNPNDADFISATGMGWFPGYAINVETGERLNIAFAEEGAGGDMIWNPSSGLTGFGGKHYIYVFGNNDPSTPYPFDNGALGRSLLTPASLSPYSGPSTADKRRFYQNAMWVNAPLLVQGHQLLSSDVTIRLRVTKPYAKYTTTGINNGNPMYTFNSITLLGAEEEKEDASLTLYPNPAENEINIEGLNGNIQYTIIDMLGRTVSTGISEDHKINTEQLSKGVYVIRVANERSIHTLKFTRK